MLLLLLRFSLSGLCLLCYTFHNHVCLCFHHWLQPRLPLAYYSSTKHECHQAINTGFVMCIQYIVPPVYCWLSEHPRWFVDVSHHDQLCRVSHWLSHVTFNFTNACSLLPKLHLPISRVVICISKSPPLVRVSIDECDHCLTCLMTLMVAVMDW